MGNEFNLERYNRNIIIEKIGEEGQIKLLNAKVLIAGAGGLGSTVIPNLASLGIGTIGIIDNDIIELTNLNRQYIHKVDNIGYSKVLSAREWIEAYNPDIKVTIYQLRLNENNADEILKDYDIIVDCFDTFESKFLLNKMCVKNNKTLIHGGVIEFYGQVITIIPNESCCISCIFPEGQERGKITKGVISPCVATIGAIESIEVVKLILGLPGTLINTLLCYDGLELTFKKFSLNKKDTCPDCGFNAFT